MASINSSPKLSWIDLYSSDTTVPGGLMVGQFEFGNSGKGFRYGLMGELGVVGDINSGSAIDAQFDALVGVASAAAQIQGNLTNGTTTITANQFDGGTVSVNVTPDFANEYTIQGHTTGASGAAIALQLDRPIRTAWTTATRLVMRRSPWSGMVKAATTLVSTVAGVSIYAIPNAAYGWVQTKGVASVLCDNSTFTVGSDVGVPGATAGTIGVNVAGSGKSNTVGRAMQANSSAKPVPVYLCID